MVKEKIKELYDACVAHTIGSHGSICVAIDRRSLALFTPEHFVTVRKIMRVVFAARWKNVQQMCQNVHRMCTNAGTILCAFLRLIGGSATS